MSCHSSSISLCSIAVTVTALLPTRLCRLAVFLVKPTFSLRLLRHILMEACQLRRRIWHMILTSFGMRKCTVSSVTADTFSRLSCIVTSLQMTVTVGVLVYALDALDTWTHDGNEQILVYRTESNVIHFRLSSPQRFVVACSATTAAFGLIILLVESKMNWNWTWNGNAKVLKFELFTWDCVPHEGRASLPCDLSAK